MTRPSASSSALGRTPSSEAAISGLWSSSSYDDGEPDEQAFAELYRAYFGFAWSSLRRLGVAPSSIDDATQELWLTVYRRFGALRPGASIRAWLFGVARRVASHHRRSEFRNRRKLAALAITRAGRSEQPIARREAALTIETFLATLDETKRVAFILSELEGWSAPEIAKMAGTNPNTIYSRVRLAREQLRAQLRAADEAELDAALTATRQATEPPQGSAKRCWMALLPELGGAAAPAAATAGTGSLGAAIAALSKLKFVVVGAAIGGVVLVGADTALPPEPDARAAAALPSQRSQPQMLPEPSVATPSDAGDEHRALKAQGPELADPTTPTDDRAPTQPPAAAIPTTTRPASSDSAAPSTAGGLAQQTEQLEAAKRALAVGEPGRALQTLRAHARDYPDSRLADVRAILQVDALCALGRASEAERTAASFVQAHPGSAAATRLRAACDGT